MRVAIHQSHYLPWLRYLDKIQRTDTFIVLDNVQFNKNGWQNRNTIKAANGPLTLTVPVYAKAGQDLHQVEIDNKTDWRKKHLKSLEQNYAKAPHFADYHPALKNIYSREWTSLIELNRAMLDFYINALSITTPIVYASDLNVPGIATERLINLINAVGGTTYYTGAYALDAYLDADLFDQAGIALELQDWHAPEYPQQHGAFAPDLAILDLLFNCGPHALETLCGQPA